jgi:hypothetical protein
VLGVFLKPIPPPYDPLVWAKKPFPAKARMVCTSWAMQGYGTPLAVYLVYLLKLAFYVYGWAFFCSFTPGMGGVATIASWWLTPIAFQKAILWSMLFEMVGLGCGSGPLTARYAPPIGGALYFLRPGTTKLPVALLAGLPFVGTSRRTWLDVFLYAAVCGALVLALVAPVPGRNALLAIAILLPALGLLDQTIFLAARAEHYWTTVMVFVLAPAFIPGAKGVQAALWFWAGFSKLNHHFPGVVGVMTSNSPVLRFEWFRRLMYRRYPDDLAPSRLATWMGHAGTVFELGVPIILLSARGGDLTVVGLVAMVMLHAFITSNVPMGVPLEWNVMVVYGGFFLFGKNAAVSLGDVTLPVAVLLAITCVAIPLLGNLFPARVSFLLAMRYYAGNWAYSVWLFRQGAHEKLGRLTKSSAWIFDQLGLLYDRSTAVGIVGKVIAFRLMHLHGRALPPLVARAAPHLDEYEWLDGEVVAGMVLGWNFGDGHLHDERLLRAVQAQCGFEEGELRCVMVEAQPLLRGTLHYRIHDAKAGLLGEGQVEVANLRTLAPWGEASHGAG